MSSTRIITARRWMIVGLALFLFIFVGGCAAPVAAPPGSDGSGATATRAMTVYRSPDCACCHVWADIARAEGWSVATVDVRDMAAFKAEHGVPAEASSCHTTLVAGYVVEGHVPLAAIEQLLRDRPDVDGIALPGMPVGSPGMGGTATGPFDVLSFHDGEIAAFGSF